MTANIEQRFDLRDLYIPLEDITQADFIRRGIGEKTITNFLNYLHLLAYASNKDVKVFIGNHENVTPQLLQIDNSWEFGPVLRLLNGEYTKEQLQILKEYINPVLIIRHFSEIGFPDAEYIEYYVATQKVDKSLMAETIKKRWTDYKKFIKRYPDINYQKIDVATIGMHKDQIIRFLKSWEEQTQLHPSFDFRVLELLGIGTNFDTNSIHMGILIDGKENKVIGLSCFSRSSHQIIASHINKVSRGYQQLGCYLFLETIMHVADQYSQSEIICVGGLGTSAQENFKNSFLPLGGTVQHGIEIIDGDNQVIQTLRDLGRLPRVLTNIWASKREV